MDKIILKQILLDNQQDVEKYSIIQRNIEIDAFGCYVFVGLRRAGKSFLLFQKMQQVLRAGGDWSRMAYVNFEDERLETFTSADFNAILECHAEVYGHQPEMLFLDEVQNVDGWEKFARRMADSKLQVFITGSNAKMLSSEIMTTLGGRYLVREVYPFSFSEYLDAQFIPHDAKALLGTQSRAVIKQAFQQYFRWGGLPESFHLPVKRDYLSSTYQKIYLGDICSRNRISNTNLLRLMVRKLAESLMHPISYTRISKILSGVGGKISVPTVGSYVQHCEDAWLLLRLRNLNAAFSERETNCKYYFIDNGILNLFLLNGDTQLMENIVALALFRRYGHDSENQRVYLYNANVEVDFYIPEREAAIQVCYRLSESMETQEREMRALTRFPGVYPCKERIIITYDEERTLTDEYGEIQVIPFWKWELTY